MHSTRVGQNSLSSLQISWPGRRKQPRGEFVHLNGWKRALQGGKYTGTMTGIITTGMCHLVLGNFRRLQDYADLESITWVPPSSALHGPSRSLDSGANRAEIVGLSSSSLHDYEIIHTQFIRMHFLGLRSHGRSLITFLCGPHTHLRQTYPNYSSLLL